jgi:hypothetical protein
VRFNERSAHHLKGIFNKLLMCLVPSHLCGLTVIAPAAFDPSRSVARLRCNLEHRPATVVVAVVASEIASVVGGPIKVSIAVKHQA